jgi:hypothetical protein
MLKAHFIMIVAIGNVRFEARLKRLFAFLAADQ